VADERDQWHRWLLDVRHGGDAGRREQLLQELYPVRDQVLDRASLRPDDVVLDVGTGDGLIGFGALDRIGPGGRVIFCDISQDLLDHCRSAAKANGQLSRCDFVLASADRLDDVPDASVDVVATRSVLIYVPDKAAAFTEFRRVLRPGGRLSIFEPVNTLMQECSSTAFFGYDLSPIAGIAAKVNAAFAAIQPPGADPMLDFDDRDLVLLAERAGFGSVSLDLRVSVKSSRDPVPWDLFLRMSGNPKLPPLAEMMDRALSAAEAAEFAAQLRPLVEEGRGTQRMAVAYLAAS
jgi:arsenite methyltransferase